MTRYSKLRRRIVSGTADANLSFADLCHLLAHLGFDEHVRGSHHIFTRQDVVEIINLQPKAGKAKPYQVKQVRSILLMYCSGESDVDEV